MSNTFKSPRIRIRTLLQPKDHSPTTSALRAVPIADRRVAIVYQKLSALSPAKRQLRKPGKGQIEAVASSIKRFGCIMPLLVTGTGEIIGGQIVATAAESLGFTEIPTIVADDLNSVEVRALRISLNKMGMRSEWDMAVLAAELEEIFKIDPTLLEPTGFTMPEFDLFVSGFRNDPSDDLDEVAVPNGPAVTRLGDRWEFDGGHELLCGNSRDPKSYKAVLNGNTAVMGLIDPPFGCSIKGHVSRTHREFVEGSGMSESESIVFFSAFLSAMTPHLKDGAIVDIFIDAQGMFPLLQAARTAGFELKTIVTWDKLSPGMGSLYRKQSEFVLVLKWGAAPHINNVELGKHGRNRTTVWSAPGLAQFGKGRKQALKLHPTIKPIGLLADALLDTSNPGSFILDPFAGSGSTLLAAHRTHRVGRGIELDPLYVDVAVARMEKLTGKAARLAGTALTFAEVAERRRGVTSADNAPQVQA